MTLTEEEVTRQSSDRKEGARRRQVTPTAEEAKRQAGNANSRWGEKAGG